MKKLRYILITLVALLGTILIVQAAPTSTIVNYLIMTGVKNADCLKTDANGLVGLTSCGTGGGGATTTINGVSGPDFTFNTSGVNGLSWASSTATLTLTQATSTAAQSGFLSATDWTTFNNKISSSTPFTAGYIPYATSSSAITNSNIFQLGTNIGIGTTTPSTILTVSGTSTFAGNIIQISTEIQSATTTISIGQSGNQGCIQSRDVDNGAWSSIVVKDGVMYVSEGQCE